MQGFYFVMILPCNYDKIMSVCNNCKVMIQLLNSFSYTATQVAKLQVVVAYRQLPVGLLCYSEYLQCINRDLLFGNGIPLRRQSKCLIMNAYISVSKDNPTMTRSQILNKVADVWNICSFPEKVERNPTNWNQMNLLRHLEKLAIV